MFGYDEVRGVPCAKAARSLVGEPEEASGFETVLSSDIRGAAQQGESSGGILR
jgi:hypothetical protein